jgi:hypothetical protein
MRDEAIALSPKSPRKIEAEGPKREKREKERRERRSRNKEKEKSKKGGKEARCKSSCHFPFLLTWVYSLAGARLRHPALRRATFFRHYPFFQSG